MRDVGREEKKINSEARKRINEQVKRDKEETNKNIKQQKLD